MNDQLQQALEELAGRGSDPGAATVWERATGAAVVERARRRRMRRRSLTSVVALGAALSIVVALVVVAQNNSPDRNVRVTPTAPTGVATAAQLVAGHWSTLPAAPIPPRDGASVVWTGTEMIVWGGATGPNDALLRNDGAAYDPATNAWRVLPAAPLSARFEQSAVWTGTEMIVWGGDDDVLKAHTTNDGAAYDPTSNTWRLLPPSPLAPRNQPVAVWTGDELIVLGGRPAVATDANSDFTDGAAYAPTSNRWHTVATPVPPDNHPLTWTAAVQAGSGRLFAWSEWAMSRQDGSGSLQLSGGADLFRLDEATGRWALVPTTANAPPDVEDAIWDGERAIVRGMPYNCGVCPGPFAPEATTLYDPATNVSTRLPADPLGGDHMSSAWTGAALFSFNGGSEIGSVVPGDATVYDPATGRWSWLPRAPAGCNGSASPTWTGRAVLMYCPGATTSGLTFIPAPPPGSATPTTQPLPSLTVSAAELSRRDHPPKAPPFPDTTGLIDPEHVQHHTGGPYISAQRTAVIALARFDCTLGRPERRDPNTSCLRVDVRFFDHYADWWSVEGGQTQFVGAWGPDHEMYAVTIFGKLTFTTTAENGGPTYVAWHTIQVDAMTGRIMMEGGLALPEHFAGVQTFTASSPAGP